MSYELPNSLGALDNANPQNEYRWAMVAAGLGAVIMAVGMFIFASNSDNRELYHGWYLLGFFAVTVGFAVSFGMKHFGVAVFCVVVIVGILGISIMKFQYRAGLVLTATAPGIGSILGDYVRILPPLEAEYIPFSNEPKWVQFDKECYRPFMAKQRIPEKCKSKDAIMATYNINLIATIKQRYALLRSTAQQIQQKTLASKADYEACIASGGCAEIPMLPIDANIKDITNSSPEYKEIRNAFWSLTTNAEMDAASCESIPLCKAMFDAGAISRTDFETLKPAGIQGTPPPPAS